MQARKILVAVAAALLVAGSAQAAITIDTVTVGNAGNAGEHSGGGAAGQGPDRICGAVSYEYNIGKYEVTAGQYKDFLNAVAGVDTYSLYNTNMSRTDYGSGITRSGSGTIGSPYTYSVASDFANRPVNYVSWGDSVRFANWLTNGQGNGSTETGAYTLNGAMTEAELMAVVVPSAAQRATWSTGTTSYFLLTSEDEWYKAAYYKGGSTSAGYWDYPTSSNTAPGQDMNDVSGNNASYVTAPNVYPIDSGKYTTIVGEFQNSDSPYGTFDQGGNVWEWNEAVIGSSRGLRGGSFYSLSGYLHASGRYYDLPAGESFDIGVGFRVSEVPEPATLSLLALGGLALLRHKR
jgi:sulfatase modifying factor 1